MISISVVLPVYNAAPFVRKAVESALAQPETGEVLLIEDGSSDNSLEICKQLDAEYEKVRLFTHEGNANLGAGLTRNVGIENARFDYIAFLDADDYYLPDRFRAERRIFAEIPDADGVYGAAGRHYYSQNLKERYHDAGHLELVSTIWPIPPDHLFEAHLGIERLTGFIQLDTLAMRSSAVRSLGFTSARLHQDSEFVIKASYLFRLYPGVLDTAVAMIGVHGGNRIVHAGIGSPTKIRMWEHLIEWGREHGLPSKYLSALECQRTLASLRAGNRGSGLVRLLSDAAFKPYFRQHFNLFCEGVNHCFYGIPGTLTRPVRNR